MIKIDILGLKANSELESYEFGVCRYDRYYRKLPRDADGNLEAYSKIFF